MIEKYVCIKKVVIQDINKEDVYNYEAYFIINNVYQFENFDDQSFTYILRTFPRNYYLKTHEMQEFFVKKSIIDRDLILSKLLEND